MTSLKHRRRRYWDPYLAGLLLGILLFATFLLTGHGLGSSGGVNRLVVAVEDLVIPRHVDTTPYLAAMAGGERNPLDHWVVWQVGGILIGGFVSGLLRGRVRLETRRGPQISPRTRWLMAFAGGILMGYGARMARGCTSGQALSGGAVLSAGSWVFMAAVFAGGYLLAWFVRRLWLPPRS
ncbi:MAG: YeeE/YedE thiosulfate transporter family protein [Gammaproteobacteria bacterium]|nr:YeeE/YedE thiosulfate transporter family protein [Gammaproteobacteria bacterium]